MWSLVASLDHDVLRVGGREEVCLIGFKLALVNWIEEVIMNIIRYVYRRLPEHTRTLAIALLTRSFLATVWRSEFGSPWCSAAITAFIMSVKKLCNCKSW